MIFILTFNLVAVSGLRADKILELARERLTNIGMGFSVCIITSLLIFPMWASDELHRSTSSNFTKLASSGKTNQVHIRKSLSEYLRVSIEGQAA